MRTKYRYDRATGAMIGPDGLPMLNQGERALPPQMPFTVSDAQPHLRSMTDGKFYDSKSEMRKEYRRAGVEEVGSDLRANRQRRDWIDQTKKREKQRQEIKGALYKAHSRMGFGAP